VLPLLFRLLSPLCSLLTRLHSFREKWNLRHLNYADRSSTDNTGSKFLTLPPFVLLFVFGDQFNPHSSFTNHQSTILNPQSFVPLKGSACAPACPFPNPSFQKSSPGISRSSVDPRNDCRMLQTSLRELFLKNNPK
jgi:hypothetical protein